MPERPFAQVTLVTNWLNTPYRQQEQTKMSTGPKPSKLKPELQASANRKSNTLLVHYGQPGIRRVECRKPNHIRPGVNMQHPLDKTQDLSKVTCPKCKVARSRWERRCDVHADKLLVLKLKFEEHREMA
jgi:hypothetical protein